MKKKFPYNEPLIVCPIDLDSIIMSSECSPELVEDNLNVSDDILYDAICQSSCSYWLLKLDVLERFSPGFRQRIYGCMDAFQRVYRIYFRHQLEQSNHIGLLKEYNSHCEGTPSIDGNIGLFNPFNLLGNNTKNDDLTVLQGGVSLREMLVARIRRFLDSGDKGLVNLETSMFLPEFINPKFFSELSEAEQVFILNDIDIYFKFMTKFKKIGWHMVHQKGDINPTQRLIKHIMGCETYTTRVRLLSWKKLDAIVKSFVITKNSNPLWGVFSIDRIMEKSSSIASSGVDINKIVSWINDAEGVFESFELDCTLHNLESTTFVFELIYQCNSGAWGMIDSMVMFQDDKDSILKSISEYMV